MRVVKRVGLRAEMPDRGRRRAHGLHRGPGAALRQRADIKIHAMLGEGPPQRWHEGDVDQLAGVGPVPAEHGPEPANLRARQIADMEVLAAGRCQDRSNGAAI